MELEAIDSAGDASWGMEAIFDFKGVMGVVFDSVGVRRRTVDSSE